MFVLNAFGADRRRKSDPVFRINTPRVRKRIRAMQKSAEVIVPSRTHHCGREGLNDEVGEESSFDSMRGKRFDAISRPGPTGSASNEQPAPGMRGPSTRPETTSLNRLVRTRMPSGVGRAVRNSRPYPIYAFYAVTRPKPFRLYALRPQESRTTNAWLAVWAVCF